MPVTWRSALADELKKRGDNFTHIIGRAGADDEDLDKSTHKRIKFTVWTANRIYFPNSECDHIGHDFYVKSVPRNPCDERTKP